MVKKHMFTLLSCSFTSMYPAPTISRPRAIFSTTNTLHPPMATLASVSKRWFSLTDTYGVDVEDGEDPVLILASAVVVDMACHPDQKR